MFVIIMPKLKKKTKVFLFYTKFKQIFGQHQLINIKIVFFNRMSTHLGLFHA